MFVETRIEIVERLQPLIFIAFGVWLIFYPAINSTPAYAAATALTETAWLGIFIATGIFQLYATKTRRVNIRRTALFVTAIIWTVWAWVLFSSLSKSFGFIIYSSAAIASIWAFVRAKIK